MIGRNKRVDRGSLFSWGPEFTAAGIGSTGIGCYFDDPVHEVFGIASRDWQSFYHFTVGGPSRTFGSRRCPHTTSRKNDEHVQGQQGDFGLFNWFVVIWMQTPLWVWWRTP
jgi:hypothetical protein